MPLSSIFYSKIRVLVCYVNLHLHFILLVINYADIFKDKIKTSLKTNNRLKIYQDVEMHHVREKRKSQ